MTSESSRSSFSSAVAIRVVRVGGFFPWGRGLSGGGGGGGGDGELAVGVVVVVVVVVVEEEVASVSNSGGPRSDQVAMVEQRLWYQM